MPIYRVGDMKVDPVRYPWGYGNSIVLVSRGGGSQQVDFGTPTILNLKGAISLEISLLVFSLGADWTVFDNYSATQYGNFMRIRTDGRVQVHGRNSGDYRVLSSPEGIISPNKWYVIRWYSDGSDWVINVDGEEVARAAYGVFDWEGNIPKRLGSSTGSVSGSPGLDGMYRWAKVRYNGNLVASWPMTEGQGNTVYNAVDATGDGTINDLAWLKI